MTEGREEMALVDWAVLRGTRVVDLVGTLETLAPSWMDKEADREREVAAESLVDLRGMSVST